ncbi:MAG: sugar ABC transporter substrate-binding protein, partial [Spirochaetales bacterium]|nr:sugar ABC transporter substrate-binding protein [Spirochaetales bacterium]
MKRIFTLLLMTVLVAGSVFAAGQQEAAATDSPDSSANLAASKAIDISDVRGSDGQLLLIYGDTRPVPPKPTDQEALDMWKLEYAGRQTKKVEMIPSPGDGIIGKKIVMIQQSEHPYWTAVSNGSRIACEAYQAEFELWNPNGDLNQQNQYVDRAIAEKADMVLLATLDAKAGVQQFKKLYDAGIPAIAYNMIPNDDAMRYVLAITAPDDFGQFKMLAEYMAQQVGGKGGVGYITHIPGGSPYFARTTNVVEYYKENHPGMKTLDIQSPGFDAPKTKQVVADWITRFGDELT